MILDYQGTKMSKSLGNIISPYEVIDKYSSEILRYYICETKAGENINFNWEDVKQKQRNLLILLNTSNYLMQLDRKKDKEEELEEKYLQSRLNSTIKEVTGLFESFRFDETITALEKFYLDLSRVYIKLTRDKSLENPGIVFHALKEAYEKLLIMFSTTCPLLTESVWQQLRKEKIVKEESVHLCDWPKHNEKKINKKLEEEFELALKIIEIGLAERDKAQIGLKWPLAKATIEINEKEKSINKELQEIIMRQLNVKKIEIKTGKSKEKEAKEISVKLDTHMTKELEAEGFAREISRKVQALRKEKGLVKENIIETHIVLEDNNLKELLENQKKFIQERTNSKILSIDTEKPKKHFQAETKDKIKDKNLEIFFNKL
jgi:isoleucyl-tRNA synthetase